MVNLIKTMSVRYSRQSQDYSIKKKKWVLRTSIYRGNIKDKVNYDKEYYISMIGNLDFSYKYWKIKLFKYNALIFREIEKV